MQAKLMVHGFFGKDTVRKLESERALKKKTKPLKIQTGANPKSGTKPAN